MSDKTQNKPFFSDVGILNPTTPKFINFQNSTVSREAMLVKLGKPKGAYVTKLDLQLIKGVSVNSNSCINNNNSNMATVPAKRLGSDINDSQTKHNQSSVDNTDSAQRTTEKIKRNASFIQ